VNTIVTFYSYKGGVGRSMALANIAVLLARRGLNVLSVDWDLEAPGLENYFSCFTMEAQRPGLLAMLMDVAERGSIDYRDYVCTFRDDTGNTLSLIASGRATDSKYSENLERFDWHSFFSKGGGEFLESLRERWRRDFGMVLIDSRTGLSDSGGICTIQLPDVVIPMFTANHQSLYGVRDVMRLAQNARHGLAHDRPQLSIVPVGSRFGNDFRESREWLDRTAEAMGEFYRDWLPAWGNPREVAEHLKIPHVDYFGYGEKLAVIEQGTTDPQGMGFTYDKIANLVANDLGNAEDVFQLKRPSDLPPIPAERKAVRDRPDAEVYKFDLYVSYDRTAPVDAWLRTFLESLKEYVEVFLGRDISFFQQYRELELGVDWQTETSRALASSALLLAILTPRYFRSRWCIAEWMTFEERRKRLGGEEYLIFPVGIAVRDGVPDWVLQYQWVDMTESFLRKDDFQMHKGARDLARPVADRLRTPPPFVEAPVVSPDEVDRMIPPSPADIAKYPTGTRSGHGRL
jgi:MinD-like ATPase involved in chromosome partitioning or flagellar assembly